MATRRNFFKYLGLAGGIAGGGVVAAAAVLPDPEQAKCVKEIENTGNNYNDGTFSIRREYGEVLTPESNQYVYGPQFVPGYVYGPQFVPGTRKYVMVSMTVGPDGNMYLLTNGKWRRIVTE